MFIIILEGVILTGLAAFSSLPLFESLLESVKPSANHTASKTCCDAHIFVSQLSLMLLPLQLLLLILLFLASHSLLLPFPPSFSFLLPLSPFLGTGSVGQKQRQGGKRVQNRILELHKQDIKGDDATITSAQLWVELSHTRPAYIKLALTQTWTEDYYYSLSQACSVHI